MGRLAKKGRIVAYAGCVFWKRRCEALPQGDLRLVSKPQPLDAGVVGDRYGDYARVVQVIETTLTRRGDGADTPIRIVHQYWSLEGELLAERDPCPDSAGEKHE
jgi:hypothetical protein